MLIYNKRMSQKGHPLVILHQNETEFGLKTQYIIALIPYKA
jgi:hypothetical protein